MNRTASRVWAVALAAGMLAAAAWARAGSSATRATVSVLALDVPSVLDVGFDGLVADRVADSESAPMFWDTRVQGLENQALMPLGTPGEMCDAGCVEAEAVSAAVERVRGVREYRDGFFAALESDEPEVVVPVEVPSRLPVVPEP